MFGKLILLFIFFFGIIFCQTPPAQVTQFTSSGTITNDPRLTPGSGLTVNIYYDAPHQLLRVDYPKLTNPANPSAMVSEINNYTAGTQLQICGSCSAYKLLTSIPIFYQELTDVSAPNQAPITNDQQQQCNAYQKVNPVSSGNISFVWVTSSGVPCRAVAVDGTTYTFTNVKPGQPPSSLFAIPPNANCPTTPVCQAPIDLVLVLDQSGSINRTEWSLLLSFADAIVNSFTIGPTQTQVGVVFFSGVDYQPGQDPSVCCGLSDPVLPLSFDEPTIKKIINNHLQTGGHTCINCGIKSATAYEPNPNRAVQVPKVMLVLTDGFNNRMTVFFATDVQNAQNLGWDMFAIGVDVSNDQELEQIATSPVSSHLLYVGDFFALKGVVNYVTTSICQDFPTQTTCGPSCKGKCICGGQCVCPDICAPPDKCHTAQNVLVNGTCVGCFVNPTVCTSASINLCQSTVCDPNTGNCVVQNTVCNPPNTCLAASCQSAVGCVYTSKCPAQILIPGTNIPNACQQGSCNNVTGSCTTTTVTCPGNNSCFSASCDPYLGCVSQPVNCDDSNDCTVDICNNATGCLNTPVNCQSQYMTTPAYKANPAAFNCLTFTCDPKVGCTTTVKTCDDGNQCTTDSCNQATGNCVNTAISCQQNPNNKCITNVCNSQVGCVSQTAVICDDGNACTNNSCNPATGQCVYTPVVCPPAPNGCTTSACDQTAQQCVLNPTVICATQASNKCITSACDPTSKTCKSTTTICNPPDLCSTASCDLVAGCLSTPKVCTNSNPCTLASCNVSTGNCVFTPIPGCNPANNCATGSGCVSTDPCNPKVCLNGTCVITPVLCPPNKCATVTPTNVKGVCVCTASTALTCPPVPSGQCGENICVPTSGKCVVQGGRVCNDNNPCTTDTCNLVNGSPQCTFTAIPCQGDSPCSKMICTNQTGVAVCINNPSANTINCTSSSQCATGSCNPVTGQCVYTSNNCSNTNSLTCQRAICNPITGTCVQTSGLSCTPTDPLGCGIDGTCVVINGTQTCSYQPLCSSNDICTIANCTTSTTGGPGTCTQTNINCNDNNPCTVNDRCTASVDKNGNPTPKCEYDSFLCPPPTNPCQNSICVNKNGVATCSTTSVNCTAPNKCTTGMCVLRNAQAVCQYTQITCGTNNLCSSYLCDPVNGCQVTNKCNDNNNCTNDICNPTTGNCSYTPVVCNSTDVCKTASCSPTLGCIQNPINCSALANITVLLDPCHYPICAPNNGCQIAIVPNTIDACGFCLQPGKCGANRDTGVPPGAIAGAVIGGAVVAGCAAAGIGIFAASKASTGFTPATDNSIVGANTNPLYKQGDNVGNNPFHNDNVGGNDAPYQQLTN